MVEAENQGACTTTIEKERVATLKGNGNPGDDRGHPDQLGHLDSWNSRYIGQLCGPEYVTIPQGGRGHGTGQGDVIATVFRALWFYGRTGRRAKGLLGARHMAVKMRQENVGH